MALGSTRDVSNQPSYTPAILPEHLGAFRAGKASDFHSQWVSAADLRNANAQTSGEATYSDQNGASFLVQAVRLQSDSGAYALFKEVSARIQEKGIPLHVEPLIGTGTLWFGESLLFWKGSELLFVGPIGRPERASGDTVTLAKLLASDFDAGSGDIPVLVEHLPDWENVEKRAGYAVSLAGLEALIGSRPALAGFSFEGSAEAVTATYSSNSRLVIVEHATPQIAGDSDRRTQSRIKELRDAGEPIPSAYKKIGNYSVFVFDTPDTAAAAQLLGQVKYEKEVRWLGYNPRALERAQRAYGLMAANLILTVLKITGLAILVCLGAGGLFGGAVFFRRRARSGRQSVYTDAGGMVRLNIDQLTSSENPLQLKE